MAMRVTLIHVDQFVFFFLDQVVEGFGDGHLALFLLLAEEAREHVLDVDVHLLDALIGDDFKRGHGALADLDFHQALIELAFAQLRAKFFARAIGGIAAQRFGQRGTGGGARNSTGRRGEARQQQVEQALFGGLLGALGDFVEFFFAHHVDGGFHQVAHHGFDVAADVADFGVLRRFHLDERAAGQAREAPRDFRFAHAGGTDHQNIFRQHFFGHFGSEFLPADAIAQGDGHGALGGGLPDDVLVELDDDFARSQFVERRLGPARAAAARREDRSP